MEDALEVGVDSSRPTEWYPEAGLPVPCGCFLLIDFGTFLLV